MTTTDSFNAQMILFKVLGRKRNLIHFAVRRLFCHP